MVGLIPSHKNIEADKQNRHPIGTGPLLRVRNLVVEFPSRPGTVKAVSDISFDLKRGETLALVGESGCGKSTTARAVIQLPRPTSGQVLLEGEDLTQVSNKRMRELRPRLQIILLRSIHGHGLPKSSEPHSGSTN